MRYAIRITDGSRKNVLFAICQEGPEVTRHYNLAKKSIESGSSDWVTIKQWSFFSANNYHRSGRYYI